MLKYKDLNYLIELLYTEIERLEIIKNIETKKEQKYLFKLIKKLQDIKCNL